MSGHSKWATTKRQKAVVDAKRGAIFTRLGNVISIAAKKGGDLGTNASLRAAVDKAKLANMPKDNIERAIKKGTGELGGAMVEELLYEAVGPGNTQYVIKCVTDNKNRSAATVRHSLSKNHGSLGAVMWNFDIKGVIMVAGASEELDMDLIDLGVDDILRDENGVIIYTKVEDLHKVIDFLDHKNIKTESAEIEYVAKTKQALSPADIERNEKIMIELEDNEDVSDYYTNIE